MRVEQRFNETTSFPYTASDERRNGIMANANKVSAGMTGNQVYDALGIPDEAETLARPLESAQGWAWDYNLYKKYRDATDEGDSYVRITFDGDGKVSKIHKENINPLLQT